ncbi:MULTISPECIES: hypothetical protein [Actinomadura]|uniref:DUF485 domain-containing protein n=1 Tax=Actinomadura yumaensis TaxID=111807 RepID=A0ABW2CXQ1_9ACTN|nr:hypothetical protein [Actinomadura sp. J1-007]MWK36450.1 hypothetical protein [Actinomadura sp. J1-007]
MTDPHEARSPRARPAEARHPGRPLDGRDAEIARHKRVVLASAGATVAAFMAFPLLTLFTGALDGVAGGVGAGYAAGLVVIIGPVAGATAYRRWASRAEAAPGPGAGARVDPGAGR